MKRAIIYARVSTDDQADRGYSLPSQLEACRRNVEMLGYEVVMELSEDYSGATPIADRPEGKYIAAAIKRRSVDAVVVYQVDRLSRDIVDLLVTVRTWLQAGIEIYSGDIGKIESEFDIVLVIKGWQGSDERKKIIERVSRGRFAKAKSGKVVGSGRTLYGYAFEKEETENGRRAAYAINETEARIVRLIFQWYVYGDENGKRGSEFVIAKRLSELGIPKPSASGGRKNPKYKNPRGEHIWSLPTVHQILINEAYTGTWYFGKHIGRGGKGGLRPRSEQVAVPIPCIIDRSLFDAAQTYRAQNKRFSRRNSTFHQYELSGIFFCSCGYAMFGYSRENLQGRRYFYYRCSLRSNRFEGLEPSCPQSNITAKPLEAFVWDYVKNAVSNSKRYEAVLRKAQQQEIESLAPRQEQLQILEDQIAEDDREFANIAAELARGVSDKVRQALNERAERIEKIYAERVERRNQIKAGLTERIYTEERIKAALQFGEDVKAGIENATEDDKRRWYHALNVSVRIKGGKARVKCIVPTKAGEFDFNTYLGVEYKSQGLVIESEPFDLTPFTNSKPAKAKDRDGSASKN